MKISLKKSIYIISAIILIIIVGIYIYSKSTKKKIYSFAIVERKDEIIQEVNATGRVKPAESVDLAFEVGGKVDRIYVGVGDKVNAGQLLITLNSADLSAQLAQAQAGLESAKAALDIQLAKLEEMREGARSEEIQIAQVKVENAKKALADAKDNLENIQSKADIDLANLYDDVDEIISDVYVKADNAVNKQIDELFSNDTSDNPQLTFLTTNSQAEIDTEGKRKAAGIAVLNIKNKLDNLPSDFISLDQILIDTENNLIIIRDFLSRLNDAVNDAIGISQATKNNYQSYVNSASVNINAAISSVRSQKQLISSQKAINQNNISVANSQVNDANNALLLAQNELNLVLAGSTSQQIKAQEAYVKQAQANVKSGEAQVANIAAQIAKTILRSPINGVVSRQNAKVGEVISIGATITPVVSIISESQFEIEVNVPEADIVKVKVSDPCTIVLDALPDNLFSGRVVFIDPAQQLIGGVIYYKVRVSFNDPSDKVKPGMTADVTIITDRRENVLVVPRRAVITKENKKFIRILEGKTIKEIEVETGLEGAEGGVEIVSGINEGEKIITFMRE